MSVRRIMEGRNELFTDLEASMNTIFDHTHCKLTIIEIINVMKQYGMLLGLFASIFSTLRQILPTADELQTLKKSQDAARTMWIHLKISRTHKLHLITDGHSLEQATRLKGIGSMLEDYVEHAHQIGMRDERRTNNIANFEAKQNNQRAHTQRGNNVDVTSS